MDKIIDKLIGIKNAAENGEMGMMLAMTMLEDFRQPLEDALAVIKEFKSEHIDELSMLKEDYPEGFGGYTFEYRNGAKRFSFKHIPQWNAKKQELSELEKMYKQAFEAKQKGILVASEDGEEIPMPEVSYSASSLILKPIKR